MSLHCPSCLKTLEYLGERPSFCSYCGTRLPAATTNEATVSYVAEASTQPRYQGNDPGLALPDRVAGYRLVREIGRGGMGIVFEGEEISSGRKVAVKLLSREQIGSSVAIDRFVQEGKLASSISHPRCVFVLAADEDDGWPFIVMELMSGTTLKDLVDGVGPLPQSEAVAKILDVIDGLSEAHRLGVIHRDVKPSNCLLDGEGRVKVGDFGLSRSISGDNRLTVTGSFLGTPHYSSPEQIKGESTDEASDVYSVAATLYFLLTGRPPFDSKDPAVALARIVSETPPSIRSIRRKVSLSLEQVVLKGLERDRRRRYRDLDEFREALQPFLADSLTIGGVWLRIGAGAIDLAFAAVTAVWVGALVPLLVEPVFGEERPVIPYRRILTDFQILLGILISVVLLLTEVFGRCSPGKKIARLRIESSDGGPPSWRRVLVRYLVFVVVSLMPLSAFPGVAFVVDFVGGSDVVQHYRARTCAHRPVRDRPARERVPWNPRTPERHRRRPGRPHALPPPPGRVPDPEPHQLPPRPIPRATPDHRPLPDRGDPPRRPGLPGLPRPRRQPRPWGLDRGQARRRGAALDRPPPDRPAVADPMALQRNVPPRATGMPTSPPSASPSRRWSIMRGPSTGSKRGPSSTGSPRNSARPSPKAPCP